MRYEKPQKDSSPCACIRQISDFQDAQKSIRKKQIIISWKINRTWKDEILVSYTIWFMCSALEVRLNLMNNTSTCCSWA